MEHTDEERQEVERFRAENDDLFELLSRRLGQCLADGDTRKLSFYVCYIGRMVELALNMASRACQETKGAGNA